MIEIIKTCWGDGFWNTVYVLFAVFALFCTLPHFIIAIWDNPYWRLKFIKKAQEEGRTTTGKMTCLTLNREKQGDYYLAEYMYMVDGKREFVTYKISGSVRPDDSDPETMNADRAVPLVNSIPLYYQRKSAKRVKVLTKMEIYASSKAISQHYTPKVNKNRDIEKWWTEPIDQRWGSY